MINTIKDMSKKIRDRMHGTQNEIDPNAPVQYSLFPEETEGRSVEKMKMKSMLRTIYKSDQFAIDVN